MLIDNKPTIDTILSCFHCGNDILDVRIIEEDKDFCCEGCRNVYQILNESGLTGYYSLESKPGNTRLNKQQAVLDFLDQPEVVEKLLDFKDDKRSRILFRIPSIHCSACIWLLENLHKLAPGILSSEVNFSKKTVLISFDHQTTSLKDITRLLDALGYMPEITFDDISTRKKETSEDKKFIYKLGVAGFAFGNIMLFSFPEYFHLDDLIDPGFRSFFGYLNILLSLPVLLYSGSGYFVSAWKGLKHKFINIDVPLALGILVMFVRSSYEIITGEGAGFMDVLVGLVFFLLIGKWFQNKTYGALSFDRDYKSYLPVSITKITEGKEMRVSLNEVGVGDIIQVHSNEMIPADSILLKGKALVDYSFVTGESETVQRVSGEKIYAGGKQTGGIIQLSVIKPVSQSYLTELWNQELFTRKQTEHIKNRVSIISKYFTITILFISLLTGVFWAVVDPSKIMNACTAILIITCPCALALTLPFTFGNALRIYNRNKLYLKNSNTIENLSKVTSIVFDKTGTITTHGQSSVDFIGDVMSEEDKLVFRAIFKTSQHPLSKKIYTSMEAEDLKEFPDVVEVPGKGIELNYCGNIYKIGSSQFILNEDPEEKLDEFKSSKVYVSKNNQCLGHYKICNEYRVGVESTIQTLSKKYKLHVLSGDNNGEELNLKKIFGDQVPLYFNQSPLDKLQYIDHLQQNGEVILMVGDGLNDAGALKQADVGLAITEDSNNFFPACDGMLKADALHKLPFILRFSKLCMQVMKYSFIISLIYNIVGLSFAVRGELLPVVAAIIMPLSSVSVIGFTVFVTTVASKKMSL